MPDSESKLTPAMACWGVLLILDLVAVRMGRVVVPKVVVVVVRAWAGVGNRVGMAFGEGLRWVSLRVDVFENLGVRLGQHVAGAVHARQC